MDGMTVIEDTSSDAAVLRLQEVMLAMDDKIDLTDHTFHHFADGVYGRELRIPAGLVIIGKTHKHSTLNILAEGQMAINTPDGAKVITAPSIFVSPAGCKKVGFAITDCVFLNVHASRETDLEKLEAELIEPEELALPGEEKWLGH